MNGTPPLLLLLALLLAALGLFVLSPPEEMAPGAEKGDIREVRPTEDRMTSPSATTPPTPTPATVGSASGATSDSFSATELYPVTRVVDGDTIKVQLPGGEETIRLIGVDTPETKHPTKTVECFGREAARFMENTLAGASVRLEPDPSQGERGKYGRLLRYVHLPDGADLGRRLIREGFGLEYTYDSPYQRQAEYRAAQEAARLYGRGLWAEGVCSEYQ